MACFTLPDGTRTQKSTGTSDRKLAQTIADQYEEPTRLAKAGLLNESRVRKVFNDILERAGQDKLHTDTVEVYLRDWLKGKANEGTNERYTHTVDLFLASLGTKAKEYLTNVTYKDIQEFIKSRDGCAPKTILIDVKTLNTAFNLAKKLHFIQDNPVEKALALNPIRGKSMEKFPFTVEQVAKILQAADGEWKTVILFGYFTGARITDCARMRWKNVNFAEKVIDYVAKKTGTRKEIEERHVMPLAPELEAHLLELPSTDNPDAFIAPGLADKDTRGRNGLSAAFKRIMLAAGVDPMEIQGKGKKKFSQLSFHSLRHACNSLLRDNGVSQEDRMALIGWKSKDINANYTHDNVEKLREQLAKLPPLLAKKK